MKQAAFEDLYIKSSELDAPAVSFRDRVAQLFKLNKGKWIDGRDLAKVGGAYAWRTRVSECRTELQMPIAWRKRRVENAAGDGFHIVSEYRYEA